MKLQNSNKVYRFKGSDETDFKRNSYIVYQEHGHNYVYGRFEPVKNLFSGYARLCEPSHIILLHHDVHTLLKEC